MSDTLKPQDVLLLVSRTRVFAGLKQRELQLFGDAFECMSFGEGETLLREGTPLVGFNVVISGSVEVCLPGVSQDPRARRARKVTLATLKSGDCFGEYAIFDDKPASASVIGVRPGQLIMIGQDAFRGVLANNDTVARKIYHNLLQIMVERLRASDHDFDVLLGAAG